MTPDAEKKYLAAAWICCALIVVGAIGPWISGVVTVSGIDGSNDGWIVLVAAVATALVSYGARSARTCGIFMLVGAVVSGGTAFADRSNVNDALDKAGGLAPALVHVGWGLNLDLIAAIGLALIGVGWIVNWPSAATSSEILFRASHEQRP